LVDLFEYVMMHELTNPKFVCLSVCQSVCVQQEVKISMPVRHCQASHFTNRLLNILLYTCLSYTDNCNIYRKFNYRQEFTTPFST